MKTENTAYEELPKLLNSMIETLLKYKQVNDYSLDPYTNLDSIVCNMYCLSGRITDGTISVYKTNEQ